jgi:hypothetical protein
MLIRQERNQKILIFGRELAVYALLYVQRTQVPVTFVRFNLIARDLAEISVRAMSESILRTLNALLNFPVLV